MRDETIGQRDSTMLPNWNRRLSGLSVLVGRAEIDVHGRAEDMEIVRQQGRQAGDHVDAAVAHEVPRHLLQRDDVGALETRRDAFKVEPAVAADAVLDVVGDEFHRSVILPAAANPASHSRACFAIERCHQSSNSSSSLAVR